MIENIVIQFKSRDKNKILAFLSQPLSFSLTTYFCTVSRTMPA